MRGTVPGLASPHPLADLLPAPLQEDEFVVRLTQGLDEVLGAAIASLDCLPAYLDPALTPADFLDWLAGWVGVELDENWPQAHRRSLVAHAVDLHRHHGTGWGMQWYLDLVVDCPTRVVDPGRSTWSTEPTDPTDPHTPAPETEVVVQLRTPDATEERIRELDHLVRTLKPAHITHRVTVVDHFDGEPG